MWLKPRAMFNFRSEQKKKLVEIRAIRGKQKNPFNHLICGKKQNP